MTTAKEIAAHYVCKVLKEQFLQRFTNEIIQYALDTILENRKILHDKRAPAHIVEYLPIETNSIWPTVQANSPLEIAQRYVDDQFGMRGEDEVERLILEYARSAVAKDRLTIKTNNVPPRLVIYLPLPSLE